MNEILSKLENAKIIPVIKLNDAELAVPLAKAMLKGGMQVAEITFRTDCAAQAIKNIAENVPEMLVGAGTVINPDMAKAAKEAGAKFIVSPGFNEATVDFALNESLAVIPGIATASEIERALMKNLSVLKLFPVEVLGGIKLLKAFKGPFPNVKFLPTGGINANNYREYLAEKNVLAVGGSWTVKEDLIIERKFDEITALCKEALEGLK